MFDGLGSFLGDSGGVISAGIDFLAGERANRQAAQQAQIAQSFSAQQSQAQMNFQERMRATQYQTTVDDLIKAGLNPMLAVSQGGAGTPVGASAVGQQAPVQRPTQNLAQNLSTATIGAEIMLKESQVQVNKENVKNLNADTAIKLLQDPKIRQETKNLIQEEFRLREATSLLQAQKTYTNAMEAVEKNKAMIQRLGDIPEARSKGKYFNEFPSAFQTEKQSQIGSSAANIAKSLTGTVGELLGNKFRPKNPVPRPNPVRR